MGRSDRSAKRAAVDSGRTFTIADDWQTLSTTAPQSTRAIERAETEALIARLEGAFGKGLCRSEAPYGETPPDAEA